MMTRLFIALSLILLAPFSADAQELQTPAKQAIIVDYDTGTVLFEKNAKAKMPTSSMSKVITAYAVFNAIQNNVITLNDTFKVSEKAWRKGGSKMFVEIGKDVKVEDLIRGVIVQSGNDATIVLAEGLAGSEDAFATTLNEIADELGMDNSHFKNASGWPDPEHYSTAEDLSILAKALITNFPQYYPYYSEKEFEYNGIKQPNRNPLLHQNIGADGIKTGHTDAGGYGLMGSGVTQDGRRVIMVVNGLESESARAKESKKLLNWGLQHFENETVFTAGEIVDEAPLVLGRSETVPLTLKEDLLMTLPKTGETKITINYKSPIQAPVTKGEEIGSMTIKPEGLPEVTKTLVAAKSVEQLGLFARVMGKAKLLITSKL